MNESDDMTLRWGGTQAQMKNKVHVAIAAGLLTTVVVGCGPHDEPTKGRRLEEQALESATYKPLHHSEWVTLKRGAYSQGHETVNLEEARGYGDLNADGVEDVAVVLVSSGGGSGSFKEIAAVLNHGGVPAHVASADLGDRVEVEAIAVESGTIRVQLIVHDEDDPMCCPTKRVTWEYRLQEGKLVKMQP